MTLFLSSFFLVSESVSTCQTLGILICCGDADRAILTLNYVEENENAICGISATVIFALILIENDDVNDAIETLIAFSILIVNDAWIEIDVNVIYVNETQSDFCGLDLALLKSKAVLHSLSSLPAPIPCLWHLTFLYQQV